MIDLGRDSIVTPMTTPLQKSSDRPISFVLHNMAMETTPVEMKLVIRPEDLTRTDLSRLTTTQTLSGAWADNFGRGIPTIQLSGTTGWGSGDLPDGLKAFQALHELIFSQWHSQRAQALSIARDPDKVKLIFADYLDGFIYVVAPQNFVLRRNKSRPLLSQYQINLTWLSDDVAETMKAVAKASPGSMSATMENALDSFLKSIDDISNAITSGISSVLGEIKGVFDKLLDVTAKALKAVQRVIAAGMNIVNAVTSGLLGIAGSLTRAMANVTSMVRSVMSLPQVIMSKFQLLTAALENAFCILTNVFTSGKFLPNYNSLYGASNCSSTAGGSPISKYATENPFPVLFPLKTTAFEMPSASGPALGRLVNLDPVLNPSPMTQLASDMKAVGNIIIK